MLNKKNVIITTAAIAVIGLAVLFINRQLNFMDDNELEEAAEEFVSKRLMIDIDFTPLTPESK